MTDCCAGAPAAGAPAARGDASASENGMISSVSAAKMSSVSGHPYQSMSATDNGENRNGPNEPDAVPTPNANVRQSGGISRPSAPITMVNDAPASPKPIMTPAVRWSIAGVVE